jgi:hypothetical protein
MIGDRIILKRKRSWSKKIMILSKMILSKKTSTVDKLSMIEKLESYIETNGPQVAMKTESGKLQLSPILGTFEVANWKQGEKWKPKK